LCIEGLKDSPPKKLLQCFRCKAISFVVTLKGHVKKVTWKLESQERTELMSQLFMTSSCAWAIFVFVSQLLRQFACVCECEREERREEGWECYIMSLKFPQKDMLCQCLLKLQVHAVSLSLLWISFELIWNNKIYLLWTDFVKIYSF